MAEPRIEEARVVHTEFAHHRQIGRHLGRMVGRNRHRLAADKDIERAGIKDDAPLVSADILQKSRGA